MKYQKGFSLIELLVALAIGLVLLLGLGTVFVTMKQTFNLRQNMASTQNNARIAMQFLSAAVRSAGATPDPLTQARPAPPIAATGNTLTVQFWADAAVAEQGCSAPLTANHMYRDVFSVAASGPTSGYLSCTETDLTASTPPITVQLIGGAPGSNNQLNSMNILYGIDPDGSGSVSQYVTASTSADWSTVRTVTFTLLFDAPLANKENQTVISLSLTQTVPFMIGL